MKKPAIIILFSLIFAIFICGCSSTKNAEEELVINIPDLPQTSNFYDGNEGSIASTCRIDSIEVEKQFDQEKKCFQVDLKVSGEKTYVADPEYTEFFSDITVRDDSSKMCAASVSIATDVPAGESFDEVISFSVLPGQYSIELTDGNAPQ